MSLMKNRLLLLYGFLFFGISHTLQSQGLLDSLDLEYKDTTFYVSATFKHTYIVMGQSVETRKAGVLEISAKNRFWNIPRPDNSRNRSFVADKMSTRFGLAYAISDRFTVGAGATTFDGIFDGFLKYRLIRQQKNKVPVSVTLFQNTSYRSRAYAAFPLPEDSSDRFSFTTQAMVASKITSKFSVQVTPTFVRKGAAKVPGDIQNHFAIGLGARYKIGNHVSIASEYFYVANPPDLFERYNAFTLGVNWEIGGLILQFHMTNSPNFVEDAYIINTPYNFNFSNPNFNFGFNATYNLQLFRKKSRK